MKNIIRKTAFLLCVLAVMFLIFMNLAYGTVIISWGEVDVNLYVVALDGVDGHGVGNTSRVVEGVFAASGVNFRRYTISVEPLNFFGLQKYTVGEVRLNVNVSLISDWSRYVEVVEADSNVIIVNAHGETLPVPGGYTREEWVDEVADAIAYRNVTWVHTAGYPFYYYYHQDDGEGEWKEEGFERFMSHIGKHDVRCGYIYSERETDITDLHIEAIYELLRDWSGVSNAGRVWIGKPLNASDFSDELILPIWGPEDRYLSGAVIKFAKTTDLHNFGFYVHIGTFQTYTAGNIPTDADYWRGYAGAAAAIWANSEKLAMEEAILNAEEAIVKAEREGRTKRLGTAKELLQNAKDMFVAIHQNNNGEIIRLYDSYLSLRAWASGSATAILRAYAAKDIAEQATKPSLIEVYSLPLVILVLTGVASATALTIRWKRNSKERRRTGCED